MAEAEDRSSEAVFAALSDPTRRRLVDWLSEEGPATATQLAARLPMSRQAVVKHLGVLAAAGLVVGGRRGREVRFRLRPEPLSEAMEWMSARAARWDERLEALQSQVTGVRSSSGHER